MAKIDSEQMLEWFANWRHDGLSPLLLIKGYTDLLLQESGGKLSNEQKEWLGVINHSFELAMDCWNYPSQYLNLRYGEKAGLEKEKLNLKKLIKKIVLSQGAPKSTEIKIPSNLPHIRGSSELEHVFNILFRSTPGPSFKQHELTPVHSLQVNRKGRTEVLVRITRDISFRPQLNNKFLPFPGYPLSVAELIIQQHGSQLEIIPSESSTEFRFTLPTWKSQVTNNE